MGAGVWNWSPKNAKRYSDLSACVPRGYITVRPRAALSPCVP